MMSQSKFLLACVSSLMLILVNPLQAHAYRHHYYSNYGDDDGYGGGGGEKVIVVNPRSHSFAAYDSNGSLVRSGTATAGSGYCRDLHRSCRTRTGTFRIFSLGGPGCISHRFPLPRGGAHMPYCMYFNHGQALHGSHEGEVVDANISHGCVRLHVWDAKWLRYNFVEGPSASNGYRGTKVVILPY